MDSSATITELNQATWWQRGIIYQIYPRSFQDSDGDGVGDLEGIRRRLDYLSWLGIDAVWVSPIFPSPMADFGYDVSDYCDIHPLFGSLADFDRLVDEVHRRGMKLILDFVPNHTSIEHPWFAESRSSRINPKRDWYIWRPPKPDGSPPNNWTANFGGAAWTLDEMTGEYYLHMFLPEQPDLNWRNPEVRQAMFDVLRFWLRRGVDGFRVDVIWLMIKDQHLRDNPPNPAYQAGQPEITRFLQLYNGDQPGVHEIVAKMRSVLDEFNDRVLIGEIYLPLERLVAYYGKQLEGAHLPFNFQLIHARWRAEDIASLIVEYERALPAGGWPNWVLGNHDQRRIADRVGEAQARVAAVLLLTLRGTPTLYYGDELGIGHIEIPLEAVRDPWSLKEPGLGVGRDPARTPMQWDGSPAAGFSSGRPWLPLSPDAHRQNVEGEAEDPRSFLSLYRTLIALRRKHQALSIGYLGTVEVSGSVLMYRRSAGAEHILVALNFGDAEASVAVSGGVEILASTHMDREGESDDLRLRPNEGLVVKERSSTQDI